MSFKQAIAATLGAGTIATIGITSLAPKIHDEIPNTDRQGSNAQQITNERLREEGNSSGDSEYLRQFIPGEVRLPEPEPKLPFRILP